MVFIALQEVGRTPQGGVIVQDPQTGQRETIPPRAWEEMKRGNLPLPPPPRPAPSSSGGGQTAVVITPIESGRAQEEKAQVVGYYESEGYRGQGIKDIPLEQKQMMESARKQLVMTSPSAKNIEFMIEKDMGGRVIGVEARGTEPSREYEVVGKRESGGIILKYVATGTIETVTPRYFEERFERIQTLPRQAPIQKATSSETTIISNPPTSADIKQIGENVYLNFNPTLV